jgi:hypothetical protein
MQSHATVSRLRGCAIRYSQPFFEFLCVVQGLRIIDLYAKKGIDTKRIYIKVCL